MATLETQKLDSIIASRRSMLLGGAALAATAAMSTGVASAVTIPSTIGDTDILNFALNLEYLEAQFYTLATEGVTADKSATSPIGTGAGTATAGGGTVTTKPAFVATPFTNANVKAYAFETALEERHHVNFLRGALGAGAVAQPNLDLFNSFIAVGNSTSPTMPAFDPFLNGFNFLLGAFIFEDVGVTAYHGGAAYLSKTYLTPALQIHAVEAYHAGLIRASLYAIDAGLLVVSGAVPGTAAMKATSITNLRAQLDGTYSKAPTDAFGLTGQDDFGLNMITVPLNNGPQTPQTATTIMDAGKVVAGSTLPTYNFYIGFARTLTQVLSVVYANAAANKGGFFPQGMNGTIS